MIRELVLATRNRHKGEELVGSLRAIWASRFVHSMNSRMPRK